MRFIGLPLFPVNCVFTFHGESVCGGIKTLADLQRYSRVFLWTSLGSYTKSTHSTELFLGPLNAFIIPCPEKGICPLGKDSLCHACAVDLGIFLWSLSVNPPHDVREGWDGRYPIILCRQAYNKLLITCLLFVGLVFSVLSIIGLPSL